MRIDLGIPVGLLIGLGCILGSVWLDGGQVGAFLNLSALLIIGGGTIGAAMVSTTIRDVLRLPSLVHKAVWGWVGADAHTLIGMLVEASVVARKGGVLALEELSNDPTIDPFLGRGLQLIVDGADGVYIREVLTSEIVAMERRHQRGITLFESMGGYAPTMGIIGTVLGLVHVLAKLSTGGTEGLGEGIAVAFIATLYGIFSANVLLLPLGSNLRAKSQEESFRREMVMEGLLGLQSSENPHLLEVRLHTFFPVTTADRVERRAGDRARLAAMAQDRASHA
jgi:chemotaxis protein MotA